MKKQLLAALLALSPLCGQTPAKPGTQTTIIDPAKMEAEKKKKAEKSRKDLEAIQEALKRKVQGHKEGAGMFFPAEGNEYTHAGVVMLKDGAWEGSDNIYNITRNIAVNVELAVPDEATFPVRADTLKARLRSTLQGAGINPQAEQIGMKPPLPLLNFVIIAQPINRGYAVYCAGNLLEEVDPKRIRLNEGTYQAITWDRQHLIVTSTEEANYHINKCMDDIVYSFIKMYRYFQSVRPNNQ